jgi:hypothetical protein
MARAMRPSHRGHLAHLPRRWRADGSTPISVRVAPEVVAIAQQSDD